MELFEYPRTMQRKRRRKQKSRRRERRRAWRRRMYNGFWVQPSPDFWQ